MVLSHSSHPTDGASFDPYLLFQLSGPAHVFVLPSTVQDQAVAVGSSLYRYVMPSLTKIRYLRLASTEVSASSMAFPASRPAWVLVPLLISSVIAASMSSYWVPKSIQSVLLAVLLKITTPTFTDAPVFSTCAFKLDSISNACSSKAALVDLSSTNTTSLTSASSEEGRDSVTWDS